MAEGSELMDWDKKHNILEKCGIFIKNIPADKLDPVLPEIIVISLSQVT